jgi:acetyl esterase/lipase
MHKVIPALLVALLAAAPVFASPPQQPLPAPPQAPAPAPQLGAEAVKIEENVLYATVQGTELRLDIYEPSDPAVPQVRPAVVLIHGGGWIGFDKSTMRGMGQFLARSGFVAFSVDYRLYKESATGDQNRWPAQLDDVQRAVRWIRANAGKYGVKPDHIGAFGHSAGAQLAALLGMEDTRDNSDPALAKYSSKVQAVVDVSGPSDFTTGHDADHIKFFTNFLDADYSQHPEVWRAASPAFQVTKQSAPFLIVHGTGDQNVQMAQPQELVDKLQAAGVPVSFVKVDDVHTFQTPEARHQLAFETLAFFNRYLVGKQ